MDKLELQAKKGLLDKMYFKDAKQFNFYVCGTYVDKEGNKKFTKWKKYLDAVANIDVLNLEKNNWKDLKYFEGIDQRQIYPHEIVLDLEDPNQLDPIVEILKQWNFVLKFYKFLKKMVLTVILCGQSSLLVHKYIILKKKLK